MSSTYFHTINLADVNWTVTVINKPRLPPKLLMTPHIPPYFSTSTPSWTRTTVADGYKFLALRRLSQRLVDRSKNTIFTYPTCIWRPLLGLIHLECSLLRYKSRGPRPLGAALFFEILYVIGRFDTILTCDGRTDRRTEGHAMSANTALE